MNATSELVKQKANELYNKHLLPFENCEQIAIDNAIKEAESELNKINGLFNAEDIDYWSDVIDALKSKNVKL